MEHIRVNDKIRLEAIKISMAQVIFDAIESNRSYLKEWLPFVASTLQLSDTVSFIESVRSDTRQRNFIYSIWYNEEFAGLIGFKETDWINRKTEIGYWLIQKMQRKGIVTNCCEKLVKYAFSKQKLNRIQIKVAENNARSESIPLRLGFCFEGVERHGEWHANKFLNLKIYSLIKSDR